MLSKNVRTSRVAALAAAATGSLVLVGTSLAPTASAATTLAAQWGGRSATSSYQCESVYGVTACVQLTYEAKTKVIHTHSWIVDGKRGTNWTVNAGHLELVRSTVALKPRKTTNPYPVATRRIAETRVAQTNDPGAGAGRDDARTPTRKGSVGKFYAARAVFTATAGHTTRHINLTDGSWVKIK